MSALKYTCLFVAVFVCKDEFKSPIHHLKEDQKKTKPKVTKACDVEIAIMEGKKIISFLKLLMPLL